MRTRFDTSDVGDGTAPIAGDSGPCLDGSSERAEISERSDGLLPPNEPSQLTDLGDLRPLMTTDASSAARSFEDETTPSDEARDDRALPSPEERTAPSPPPIVSRRERDDAPRRLEVGVPADSLACSLLCWPPALRSGGGAARVDLIRWYERIMIMAVCERDVRARR